MRLNKKGEQRKLVKQAKKVFTSMSNGALFHHAAKYLDKGNFQLIRNATGKCKIDPADFIRFIHAVKR